MREREQTRCIRYRRLIKFVSLISRIVMQYWSAQISATKSSKGSELSTERSPLFIQSFEKVMRVLEAFGNGEQYLALANLSR